MAPPAVQIKQIKMSIPSSTKIRETIARRGDASDISREDIENLESEFDKILGQIAARKSPHSAESDLLELGSLQELLALLAFKYGIELTSRQRRLVREYDRWDDKETRVHVYKEVLNGQWFV